MDGGVKYNLDVSSGVHKCEEKGFKEEDIIVDIILCSNSTLEVDDPDSLSPIGSYYRYAAIAQFDSSMGVVEDIHFYMKNVTIRYLIAPTRALPSSIIPLNFAPADIETMLRYGQEDAKSIIEKGIGKNAEEAVKKRLEEKTERYVYKRKTECHKRKLNLRNLE